MRGVGEFARDRTRAIGRKSICLACDREKSKPQETRICEGCGVAPAVSTRHHYCEACREAAERRRRRRHTERHLEKSTARGYGTEHQKLRKQWAPAVERGEVQCARCGRLIDPGSPWDLGHDDHDRTQYAGPEHRACNRATAGRRRQKRALRANWW